MTIAIENQIAAFLGAFLVGAALGFFYDLLRPFRLGAPQWKEWFLDFFFWIVVTLAVFFSAPLLEDGQIRIYMLLSNFLGALCYFMLLSRPFRACCARIAALWRRVKNAVLRPFRWLYSVLVAPLSLFLDSLGKTLKKFFSFPFGWVKMRAVAKKTAAKRQAADSEEGLWYEGQPVYHQKGWSSLEDRGGSASDLHRLHDGDHSGENYRSQ